MSEGGGDTKVLGKTLRVIRWGGRSVNPVTWNAHSRAPPACRCLCVSRTCRVQVGGTGPYIKRRSPMVHDLLLGSCRWIMGLQVHSGLQGHPRQHSETQVQISYKFYLYIIAQINFATCKLLWDLSVHKCPGKFTFTNTKLPYQWFIYSFILFVTVRIKPRPGTC